MMIDPGSRGSLVAAAKKTKAAFDHNCRDDDCEWCRAACCGVPRRFCGTAGVAHRPARVTACNGVLIDNGMIRNTAMRPKHTMGAAVDKTIGKAKGQCGKTTGNSNTVPVEKTVQARVTLKRVAENVNDTVKR